MTMMATIPATAYSTMISYAEIETIGSDRESTTPPPASRIVNCTFALRVCPDPELFHHVRSDPNDCQTPDPLVPPVSDPELITASTSNMLASEVGVTQASLFVYAPSAVACLRYTKPSPPRRNAAKAGPPLTFMYDAPPLGSSTFTPPPAMRINRTLIRRIDSRC